MKKILLLALMMVGISASAQWKSSVSVDEFTDEASSIPYIVGEGNDRTYDKPTLAYYISSKTFAILSSGYYIEDNVKLTVRVDKNEVRTINGIGSNEHLIFDIKGELLTEMKNGSVLFIKEHEDYNTMKFSLIGFTKEYNNAK